MINLNLNEDTFYSSKEDCFVIYQIKSGEKYRDIRFSNMVSLNKDDLEPKKENYDLIYSAAIPDELKPILNNTNVLDYLYQKFNLNIPSDFKGHSLSVSDVIALNISGEISHHFVDSVGFSNVYWENQKLLVSLADKYEWLSKKLDTEYTNFERDIYEAHNILEMHTQITGFVSTYESLNNLIYSEKLPEDIVNALLNKQDVIDTYSSIWIEEYSSKESDLIESFNTTLIKAVESDANRTLLQEFHQNYKLSSQLMADINFATSHMSIKQCQLFLSCLENQSTLNTTDIFHFTDIILDEDSLDTVAAVEEKFIELKESSKDIYIATAINVLSDSKIQSYNNKVLVLNPARLKPSYRRLENQILIAESGNGCSYTALGQSVFSKNLFSGEKEKWSRSDFLGVIDMKSFPVKEQNQIYAAIEKLAENEESEVWER